MEKKSILDNKKVVILISILISFVLWVIITTVVSPVGEVVINGVGVNVNTQSGILGDMGLSAIDGAESTVNVTIKGSRSIIGGVSAEDITITPSLSGVTGSGTFNLKLTAVKNGSKDFEIVSLNPETISVKFDKYVDKTVELTYVIDGEYNIPDEYIQEQIYTNPSTITVNGPETDMDKFEKAVIYVTLDGEYTESFSMYSDVKLLDKDGNNYEYNPNEISLSEDSASVVIPIHHIVNLPVHFQYTGIPEYFDTSKLKYKISDDEIKAEGERAEISKYSDYFMGYIDISELSLSNNIYNFAVKLPNNIGNVNGIENIQIEYDLSNYEEKTFNVRQINVINIPNEFKITNNTTSVNVKMIGPKDVIDKLSSKNIVLQVDASKKEFTQTGQYKMYADVVLPNKEFAWAIGTYGITVTVK